MGSGLWSLQLLADEFVALEVVSLICPKAIRKTLKNHMAKRKIASWVIPPDQVAEFAACLEVVLQRLVKLFRQVQGFRPKRLLVAVVVHPRLEPLVVSQFGSNEAEILGIDRQSETRPNVPRS